MKINPSKAYSQIQQTYNSDSTKESGKSVLPKQGEVIKGEIIDLQHNNVKIKLTNGQIIEAKMTEAFEFYIGQKLEFFVKESGSEQLLLKPLLEEGGNTQNKLIQILENAGISTNQVNIDVVAKLLEHNMPVDKETLLKVIPFTKQFNTSIDNILFLVKHNMPVTKDNLEQLQRLLNGNNKIVQNLASISDDLSLLLKDGLGQEMAKVLLKDNPLSQSIFEQLRQQVLNMISGQNDQRPTQTQTTQSQATQPQATQPQSTQPQSTQQSTQQPTLQPTLQPIQQSTQQLIQQNAQQGQQIHQTEHLKPFGQGLPQSGFEMNANANAINPTVNEQPHQSQLPLYKDVMLNSLLSETQIQNLEAQILKAIKAETEPIQLSLSKKSISEIFNELNTFELSPALKDKIADLLTSKITYTLFSKELFINQEHLQSPEQLKNFYERLHEKVVELLELDIYNAGEKAANVSKDAHQIKSAIEFMGDLNQNFNYIQLPMLFGDRLLHSELYVLNDKRKMKGDKGTLTALIRLDMVNLGHLDIYVTKTDKNVHIQFFTEDENKSAMIDSKTHAIHNQLGKLGFNVLGISVTKKEKDFNPADDFLKKEEVHEVKRFTFDMRA